MRQEKKVSFTEDGSFTSEDEWILDTEGVNLLEVMCYPDVDHTRTISNDIVEIIQVTPNTFIQEFILSFLNFLFLLFYIIFF